MAFDPRLRSPKERPLFILGAVLSALAYVLLIASMIGALYGAFIALFVLMAHAMFLAYVRGNGVRVSAQQLPELHARCKAIAARLGLEEETEVYVLQSGGVLNAFATKLLSRRFVILYSALLDATTDDRQIDFVIGHEMGHLAAGHLKYRTLLLPMMVMPWIGTAYSRACEYTSDRAGLECSGGIESALRGLAVLAAGGKQAQALNLDAFLGQQRETGGFWMSVLELNSTHPYLCKRGVALREFVAPGTTKEVGRPIFAYLLAPVFGIASPAGGAAGVMMMAAMIGILAAIAIPNLAKFEERARQQRAAIEKAQNRARPAVPTEEAGEPGADQIVAPRRGSGVR